MIKQILKLITFIFVQRCYRPTSGGCSSEEVQTLLRMRHTQLGA